MMKNRHARVLPAVAVSGLLIAALALSACSSQVSASSRTGAKAAVATASTAAATPAAPAAAAAPAGPDAQSVILDKCTGSCHKAAKVLGYRAGSASQAQSVVASMTKKGGLTQSSRATSARAPSSLRRSLRVRRKLSASTASENRIAK
jgi:hypothetical protein